MGIVGTLLFFASIIAHELAHSLVAKAKGIPVEGITLFVLEEFLAPAWMPKLLGMNSKLLESDL